MGICVNKPKDKQIIYTSKAIHRPDKFDKIDFYFQTENLLRVEADCLVLFCDEKMNLNKNSFLAEAGRYQARKASEFAEAYVASCKSKITAGDVILFPINIPTLRFKRICLACLNVWDGHDKIKQNLNQIVENMFKTMEQVQINSIVMTEFNEQFGIPTQLGCKTVLEALQKSKDSLRSVTFVCSSTSSQSYYMQRITQNKLELSSVYTQSKQTEISNYY